MGKRLRCGTAFLTLGCLSSLGCAGMPTALVDDVHVAVEAEAFSVVSTVVQGSLVVQIANHSARSLWFNPCGSVLERNVELDWVTTWHSICLASSADLVEIGASSTYQADLPVAAELERGEAKNWSSPIDGTYRMVVNLHRADDTPLEAMSVPFHIVVTGEN